MVMTALNVISECLQVRFETINTNTAYRVIETNRKPLKVQNNGAVYIKADSGDGACGPADASLPACRFSLLWRKINTF